MTPNAYTRTEASHLQYPMALVSLHLGMKHDMRMERKLCYTMDRFSLFPGSRRSRTWRVDG